MLPFTPAGAQSTKTFSGEDWPLAGQNLHNTRNNASERKINSSNVANLKVKWSLQTEGDVVATPTVYQGALYTTDRGGNLFSVNTSTGKVIWSKKVGDYTGITGDASRTSPLVFGDEIIIGTGGGANLVGVDRFTGAFRWKTALENDNIYARVTGSPIIDNGIVYIGVSSGEETAPPDHKMVFRGTVQALDARTGKLLWKTFMVPEGYTGGAVWSSTPVMDHRRGLLYVSTGNNYTVPDGVCETPDETGCAPMAEDNYIDAVVALNPRTGKVAWAQKTLSADVFPLPGRGLDYDFASGPNLYTTTIRGRHKDIIGVGQKSGYYYAFDPDNKGKPMWQTLVGPGSKFGGIQWGSATDGRRIYTAINNYDHKSYEITSVDGKKTTITGGSWAALDAATGKILWQTADPQGQGDMGFVSAANGVVYANSLSPTGNSMYALDGATGAVRWGFDSGGSVVAGAAVVNGTVYWGSGYWIPWTNEGENNMLYAFSLDGR
ncbi:outer membrane protein assembly factor BamB family protein [Actinomadura barringtoniae]|uniref:outer membrane protein assembly factor BamB family protein n=1 Tax=Actinomadura barringtoniae TaxID=1427535 RepID=UPI002442DE01|nr:PQQ-binding-like beta-propeller repeat protein [Actinomadura barringtoniae]